MIAEIALGLLISYTLLFVLSVMLKDNSIADIFWGIGFLQVAIHSLYLSGTLLTSQIVMLAVILLWSLRISGYILSKKLVKKGEDARYQKWREEWKHFYLRSFFQVYMLQGILMMVVATPIIAFSLKPAQVDYIFIGGIVLALAGLLFETVADLQMRRFVKTKKKGEIMKTGLWRYSRHPNYFGESVFWLGLSIAAIQSSVFALVGWLAITVLLRFVSGVPMAEERMKGNKEFEKYKKRTPAMLPNFFR